MTHRGLPSRPRLADGVRAERTEEGTVLRHRRRRSDVVYSLGEGAEEFADRVLPLLDGQRELAEITRSVQSEFDLDSLLASLDRLAELSLLIEGQVPTEPVDGLRAYRILRRAEKEWYPVLQVERDKTPELADPASSLAPDAYRRWFRGWWAENLHFAVAAPMKFALVANRCTPHRDTLASFFLEEHDHILIFRDGTRALGVDPDEAMRAPPLPEVAALNSFILRGGKRQPLYLAWIADQVERAQSHYMRSPSDGTPGALRKELEDQLADVPEFLRLVFSHADIEQAAAHATGGREMFEATDAVAPADLAEIRELAFATELLFHRKEVAVLSTYGRGTARPPRRGDNDLSALPRGAPPVDLADAVPRVVGAIVARLLDGDAGKRLQHPEIGAPLVAAWTHLHHEWARSAFDTPVLARRFEQRYPVTRLALSLVQRRDHLGPEAPTCLEARALAAVVSEAAETSVSLALAQAALLDRLGAALQPALRPHLAEAALTPLFADLGDRRCGPAEALACLGAVGSEDAQSVGVHLQVLGELLGQLVGAIG